MLIRTPAAPRRLSLSPAPWTPVSTILRLLEQARRIDSDLPVAIPTYH